MGRSLRSEKEGNRFLVKWQFNHGQRNPNKISRHTRVPLPTVKTYLRKLRRGESLDDKPRSGRPRIVVTTFRRRLAQLKSIYPEKASRFFTCLMHERYDVEVSERTVQRTLNQMGYSWQRHHEIRSLPLRSNLDLHSSKLTQRMFGTKHGPSTNATSIYIATPTVFGLR